MKMILWDDDEQQQQQMGVDYSGIREKAGSRVDQEMLCHNHNNNNHNNNNNYYYYYYYNEPSSAGAGEEGMGWGESDGRAKDTIDPSTLGGYRALPKAHIAETAFISDPSPGLSSPLRSRLLKGGANYVSSASNITSPDTTSAFVATGRRGLFTKPSPLLSPPMLPPPLLLLPSSSSSSSSSSSLTARSKEHIINQNSSLAISAYEMQISSSMDVVDCRVLSDEVAVSLPSPVDVVFPFPLDHMDGNDNDNGNGTNAIEDDESKDSDDDGQLSRSHRINTTATMMSITADIAMQHSKLVFTVEPSPLHLLVRMPPSGNNVFPFLLISTPTNTLCQCHTILINATPYQCHTISISPGRMSVHV